MCESLKQDVPGKRHFDKLRQQRFYKSVVRRIITERKKVKTMTIMELTKTLGETIEKLHDSARGSEELATTLQKASGEAQVAKQFLKGADIVLRADRNSGRNDRIDRIVG